jgi:hypothetical protein
MNETDCAYYRGHGRSLCMRDDAQDADVPRRIDGPRDTTLPAPTAATATSSAPARHLPGRNDGSGRHELPASAAAAAATAGAQVRRTRLNLRGRCQLRRPLHVTQG